MLVKYTGSKPTLDLRRPEFKGKYLFVGHTPTEMSRDDGTLAVKLYPRVFSEVIVSDEAPEDRAAWCKRVFGKHISHVTKRDIEEWVGFGIDLRKSKNDIIDIAMETEK